MNKLLCLLMVFSLLVTPAVGQDDEGLPEDEPPVETTAESEPQSEDDPAPDDEPQYTCFVTGAPWNISPTRVEAVFVERGQLKRARFISMAYFLATLRDFQEQGRPLSVRQIKVADYGGRADRRMLEIDRVGGDNVWFVFTETTLRHTRPPFIVAFATEQEALDYGREHGGKPMNYAKLLTKIGEQLASVAAGQ